MNKTLLIILIAGLAQQRCTRKENVAAEPAVRYSEQYRPQLHFSPEAHWMNDPNGLVYDQGEYHLFFQHYPEDVIWGPMHWGHAVSTDLVKWKQLPIALYPDSLGMIFSGSAVIDKQNSSGMGSASQPPMVAIFTYHNAKREKEGHLDYETQGMAYSTDKGRSWKKYQHNPVIKNPGTKDFRDPKVTWHEASKKWVLTLVAGDHAEFYGSKDLKEWSKLSEFGKEFGSHGGVWECPDLFPLAVEGEGIQKWILIININPGGPNGGSGTQYFIGDFDGVRFTCDTAPSEISWIDYGPDNYAGITWSNSPGDKKMFIGWMSNWAYAQEVPTLPWRSANTIPRELKLLRVNGKLRVASSIVAALSDASKTKKTLGALELHNSIDVTPQLGFPLATTMWQGSMEAKDFQVVLSNALGQRVVIGFEKDNNRFFMDRRNSGNVSFAESFGKIFYAPRTSTSPRINFSMVLDVSSAEVFLDDGITVMTGLFFPDSPYTSMELKPGPSPVKFDSVNVHSLPSIWQ